MDVYNQGGTQDRSGIAILLRAEYPGVFGGFPIKNPVSDEMRTCKTMYHNARHSSNDGRF
jgi:hypothetical protein